MDKANVVSNESVGGQGLYTEEERLDMEQKRMNKHQGKFNDPKLATKQTNLKKQPEDFVFHLSALPGPVTLSFEDGEEIFSSKDNDVEATFPVKLKGFGNTLKVVLDMPTMNFKTTLSYPLKEGMYVTLEGTDEGLKNSQVSIK
jgi:hypothetical protein